MASSHVLTAKNQPVQSEAEHLHFGRDIAPQNLLSNRVPKYSIGGDDNRRRIVASFRAMATWTFFSPARCMILRPHSRSGQGRSIRVSRTLFNSRLDHNGLLFRLRPFPGFPDGVCVREIRAS